LQKQGKKKTASPSDTQAKRAGVPNRRAKIQAGSEPRGVGKVIEGSMPRSTEKNGLGRGGVKKQPVAPLKKRATPKEGGEKTYIDIRKRAQQFGHKNQ